MDGLFIAAVAELTLVSLVALYFKSKIKIILVLLIGVAISWYIGVVRVEMFSEIALREYNEGLREQLPSDGGPKVFSYYLGWVPGLIYSGVVYGVGTLLLKLYRSNQNENT
jgi:hypothetical protein